MLQIARVFVLVQMRMFVRRRDARSSARLGLSTFVSSSGKPVHMAARRKPFIRHISARQAEPTLSLESISPVDGSAVGPTLHSNMSFTTCHSNLPFEHAIPTCHSNMPFQQIIQHVIPTNHSNMSCQHINRSCQSNTPIEHASRTYRLKAFVVDLQSAPQSLLMSQQSRKQSVQQAPVAFTTWQDWLM